jgi:hypothetical protein
MLARNTNEEDERYNLLMIFSRKPKRPAVADLAGMVGATDDAHVIVSGTHDLNGESINIVTNHPKYYTSRILKKDDEGRVTLFAEKFDVAVSERGKGNFGPQVFGRMVEQASSMGVDRIVTTASRSPNENGYYTWARFGYDAPLNRKEKEVLPATLGHAERVSDLMTTEEGRRWWKDHGSTKKMTFNLKDGSRSRKVWTAYLQEKANTPTSHGKTWRRRMPHGRRSMRKIG